MDSNPRTQIPETMTQTRQILIVDDDQDLRQALGEQLALHPEFAVAQAPNVAAARQAMSIPPPDIVIMDVGLPDMDGREAVRLLRSEGFKRPIIMLTGRDSDAD